MKTSEQILKEFNKEVTLEDFKKIIYTLFAMFVMFMPVMPEIMGYGFHSFKWTIFVPFTLVISGILLVITVKEKKFHLSYIDVLWLIYIVLVFIATLVSKYGVWEALLGSYGRGEGLLLLLCYGLTFIIFSKGYKYITWGFKAGIIAAVVVSIYSILQGMLPVDIKLFFEPRRIAGVAMGTMKNQNFLSSYICLFLPMIAFHYINTGKITSLILAIMLFLAQVFSVTLGGYITFIAMYLLVVIYSVIISKKKCKTIFNTVLLSALIVISFRLVNYSPSSSQTGTGNGVYAQEIAQLKSETENLAKNDDDFGTGRLGIWKKTLMVINNHKWFGVGPDSLKMEIGKEEYLLERPYDAYRYIIIDKAHSEPLQMAATTGIPSMIAYLVFAASICINLLIVVLRSVATNKEGLQDKNTLYIHMVLISILAYLMQSMINISVVQVAPVFWAMLGIGVGIIYKEKGINII